MLIKFCQFLFSWDYIAWCIVILVFACFIAPIIRINIKEEEKWRVLGVLGVVFTLGVIAAFSSRQIVG